MKVETEKVIRKIHDILDGKENKPVKLAKWMETENSYFGGIKPLDYYLVKGEEKFTKAVNYLLEGDPGVIHS